MAYYVHNNDLDTWHEFPDQDRACFTARRMSEVEKQWCVECKDLCTGRYCQNCGRESGDGGTTIYSAIEGNAGGPASFIERWKLGEKAHGPGPSLIIPRCEKAHKMCCGTEVATPYCPVCGKPTA